MSPKDKPQSDKLYRGYTGEIAEAVRLFVERYGKEPQEVFEYMRLVWCGPVEEELVK